MEISIQDKEKVAPPLQFRSPEKLWTPRWVRASGKNRMQTKNQNGGVKSEKPGRCCPGLPVRCSILNQVGKNSLGKKELGDSVVKQSQLLWKHYGHVKASIKNCSWKSDDYSNSAYQIQIWMLDFWKYLLDFSSSSSGSCSSKCRDFTQCFHAFTPYAYLNGKLHSEFSELSSWDWYSDTAFLFTPCQWRTVVNVWQLLTAASQNLGRTRELPAKLPSFSVKKHKLHSAGGRFCVKHPSEDTVYLSSQIFLIHLANWFLMQNIFWKWNFCIAYIILDNTHMMYQIIQCIYRISSCEHAGS